MNEICNMVNSKFPVIVLDHHLTALVINYNWSIDYVKAVAIESGQKFHEIVKKVTQSHIKSDAILWASRTSEFEADHHHDHKVSPSKHKKSMFCIFLCKKWTPCLNSLQGELHMVVKYLYQILEKGVYSIGLDLTWHSHTLCHQM